MSEPATSSRQHLAPGHAVGVTEELIKKVVHGFYGRVRQDPALGPVFARVIAPESWPAHLSKMGDFWSSVMLMSGRFHGAPVPAHARIADIEGRHFARWLGLFEETVGELCPPEAAALFIKKSRMIAQSLQLGVAAARGRIAPISDVGLTSRP